MGFYSPATLVKDAERHGLKIKPIDVTRSDWECTVEGFCLRIGLRYVRGLRESAARALVRQRQIEAFTSIDDLALRVPELQKSDMRTLAEIGALNFLNPEQRMHRRDALWQVERASRRTGPLLEVIESKDDASPLAMMTPEERLIADFDGAGMTTGPHPMAYCRWDLNRRNVLRATDLRGMPNGRRVRVAGCVIARQRPGTAKGFVFLSLEDETGIANIIITPDVLDKNRLTIIQGKFLLIEGPIQNVDNVIHVKASRVESIAVTHAAPPSRDFH
jgi:error-prone DNA polymerase